MFGARSRSTSKSEDGLLLDKNKIRDLMVLERGKNVATTNYGFVAGNVESEAKGKEFTVKINKGDTVMTLGKYWTDQIDVFKDDFSKGKAAYVDSESEGDREPVENSQESLLENEQGDSRRHSEESDEQSEEDGARRSEEESVQESEEDNQNRSPTRRDVHNNSTEGKTPTRVSFADIFPVTPAREQRQQRLAEERRQQGQSQPSSPKASDSNWRSRSNSLSREEGQSTNNTPRGKSQSRDSTPRDKSRSRDNTRGDDNRSREEGQSTNNTPRGKSQSRDSTPRDKSRSRDNTRGDDNRSREEGQSTNNTPRDKSRSRDNTRGDDNRSREEGQSTNNTRGDNNRSRDEGQSTDNTRGDNNRSRDEGQSTDNTRGDNNRSRDEGQSTDGTPSQSRDDTQSTTRSQGIPLASAKLPYNKVLINEEDDTTTEMTIRGCMKRGRGTLMLLNAPSKNPEYPNELRGFLKASRQHKTKVATFLQHNNNQMIKYGSIEKLQNANVEDIRIWAIYDTDQNPSQTIVTDANGNQHEIYSCFREPWTIVDIGILNEEPELYKRSDILDLIGDSNLDEHRRAVMQPIPVHSKPLKDQKRTRNFGLAAQASQPTTARAGSQRAESQGAEPQARSQRGGSQRAESQEAGSQRAGSQRAESQGAEPQARSQRGGSQRAEAQEAGSQRAGPRRAESQEAGWQRARSQRAESQGAEPQARSQRGGSQRAESQEAGSQRAGPRRAESQEAGSQRAGSHRAESQEAGSQRAGSQGRYHDSTYGSQEPELVRPNVERKRRDDIEKCVICDKERGSDVVTIFPCGHKFDYTCFMELGSTDPYCKTCDEAVDLGVYIGRNGRAVSFELPLEQASD